MDDKQIDDIVSMIDQFMAGSGGHMNVEVHADGKAYTKETCSKTVTQMNSRDCAGGNSACSVPTLFEGLDAAEEDSYITSKPKGGK